MAERDEEEKISLLGRIYKTALMEAATGGLGSGLDAFTGITPGTDVTGMSADLVQSGSVVHHGPGGEDLLDRPGGGYLAHASTESSMGLEHAGPDASSIARSLNDAGQFSIDGNSIQVLDYVPGGDMVQAVAGNVDPGQMVINLVKMGIEQEARGGGGNGLEMTGEGSAEHAATGHEAGTASAEGSTSAGILHTTGGQTGGGIGAKEQASPTDGGQSGSAAGMENTGSSRKRGHVPDADENARDLDELSLEHRRHLDLVVETSDMAHVHTEIHEHGRTLTMDTDFEARVPDNDLERREAAENVDAIAHGGQTEATHDEPGIHFRSQVQAHLDAAARDEGMSI